MASARTTREGERRLSLGTLVIASIASAVAAVVVSTFWRNGTPIAAAVTPVVVALVSELLHRPTAVIAERLTSDADALPLSARLSRLDPRKPGEPRREPIEPTVQGEAGDPPPRVPKEPEQPPGRRLPGDDQSGMRAPAGASPPPGRSLPWKAIAATGILAFLIGMTVLTVPELIAGRSLGRGGDTTVFGGGKQKDTAPEEQERTIPEQQDTVTQPQQTTPQDTQQQTTPQQVAPDKKQKQSGGQADTQTTPTTPQPPR